MFPVRKGRTLEGSKGVYEICDSIGKGKFGVVVKAKCVFVKEPSLGGPVLNETYAIKSVPFAVANERDLKNLHREIEIMERVNHPNVIRLIELFSTETHYFFVIPYYPNGALFEIITTRGKFDEHEAISVVHQILEGLHYLHSEGIAHRDIKPDNILCKANPDGTLSVAISDFGLSNVFSAISLMKTDCGTSHYAAPEIYKREKYGPSCDMWSFGVTVFALVTGHFPFFKKAGLTLRAAILRGQYDESKLVASGVSPMCRDFISKLLVLAPEGRMTAAQALQHPWLRSAVPNTDLSKSVDRLRSSMDYFKIMSQGSGDDDDDDDDDDDVEM